MAEPLSLGQLGRVLSRYWILIVVGTLLGGLAAFGVTRFMPSVYRATAIQLVKGLPGSGAAANYQSAQFAISRAKTYPPFVYNSTVLDGVRRDLDGAQPLAELREDITVTNPVDTPLLESRPPAPRRGGAGQGELGGPSPGGVHHRDRERRWQVTDHRGDGRAGGTAHQSRLTQGSRDLVARRTHRVRVDHRHRADPLQRPLPAPGGIAPQGGGQAARGRAGGGCQRSDRPSRRHAVGPPRCGQATYRFVGADSLGGSTGAAWLAHPTGAASLADPAGATPVATPADAAAAAHPTEANSTDAAQAADPAGVAPETHPAKQADPLVKPGSEGPWELARHLAHAVTEAAQSWSEWDESLFEIDPDPTTTTSSRITAESVAGDGVEPADTVDPVKRVDSVEPVDTEKSGDSNESEKKTPGNKAGDPGDDAEPIQVVEMDSPDRDGSADLPGSTDEITRDWAREGEGRAAIRSPVTISVADPKLDRRAAEASRLPVGPYVVFLIMIGGTIPWRSKFYYEGGLDSVVLAKAALITIALGLAVLIGYGRPARQLRAVPLLFLLCYLTCTMLGALSTGKPCRWRHHRYPCLAARGRHNRARQNLQRQTHYWAVWLLPRPRLRFRRWRPAITDRGPPRRRDTSAPFQ